MQRSLNCSILSRGVLTSAGLLLIGYFNPGCCSTENNTPNYIFIFADNMGYGDVGCFGKQLNRTLFIDNMAKDDIHESAE